MQIKVGQSEVEETYEIDDSTLASGLLSTINEQPGFADKFTTAVHGVVLISFDGDHSQDAKEVLAEAGDVVLPDAFGSCAVCVLLPPKVAGKDQIKLLSANGEPQVALVVPSAPTFKDVLESLEEKYEGVDLTLFELCAVAKNGFARFKLHIFDASSDVIEGVSAKVRVGCSAHSTPSRYL